MCVILLLVTYALLANVNGLDDEDTQIGYAVVFNGLFMLLVCVLAGTAIAQEKESDTWTLLLATPISGWDIVWGKVLGQLRRLISRCGCHGWLCYSVLLAACLVPAAGGQEPAGAVRRPGSPLASGSSRTPSSRQTASRSAARRSRSIP